MKAQRNQMERMLKVSIIILNYNGIDHLGVCLRSLSKQTFSNSEIVLVDNGSTDGSIEFVRREFPEVKLILLHTNTGFAVALNKGITETSSPYIALLNNDTEVEPRWLELLVEGLKTYPDVGATACKMLNFYSRDVIDAAGDILTRSGTAEPRGYGEKDSGQYNIRQFVFGPCAGAALYRREVFDQVGLFDESFFMYYEDVDLDFRIQRQGWQVLYVPSSVCYHKRGATSRTMHRLTVKLHVRNNIFYLLKNIPAKVFMKRLPSIVGSVLRNWYRYSRDGYLLEVLKGIGESVPKMPEMFSKRKVIQEKSRVSVGYIESLMNGGADLRQAPDAP